MCFLSFFFFKQKTAYEMRISDWSSDVCSSDLARIEAQFGPELVARHHGQAVVAILAVVPEAEVAVIVDLAETQALGQPQFKQRLDALMQRLVRVERACRNRSEEHTSELQSLMRISYAVFCLKKKITCKRIYTTQN